LRFSFSNYDLTDQPMAIVCTPDERPIGIIGSLIDLQAEIYFNEMSSISFQITNMADGTKTPFYDDVVGMNVIDLRVGDSRFGKFILAEPEETNNGIFSRKVCRAYSLEYEMTYKKIFLDEGTYNFWNPLTPDATVLGIILSYLPCWAVGEVDPALIGKYRTFASNQENIYNFIKNTVQKTYQCIFDFDTYDRKIHVRSATGSTGITPVYLSTENLAKEIKIKENSESFLTVLDVNGADGVTIRSVNPLGTNKIYNLDHFMTSRYFPDEIIIKWQMWKDTFRTMQERYFSTTIRRVMKTSEILLLENQIRTLKTVKIAALENEQSVYIAYLATLSDTAGTEYQKYTGLLADVNTQIELKNTELTQMESELASMREDYEAISAELSGINSASAFSAFFTDEEMCILDRYFKEDTLSDSNFVYSDVHSYNTQDLCTSLGDITVSFVSDKKNIYTTDDGRQGASAVSGSLRITADGTDYLLGEIIHADLQTDAENSILLSAFLGASTINETEIPSGCIVLSGTVSSLSEDIYQITSASVFITQNTTEYQKYAVEKELYEHGVSSLETLAHPSYTFDITSSNFFMIEDFVSFSKSIQLGAKLYMELSDDEIIEPIFIGFSVSFDSPDSMRLIFSDTYNTSDKAFSLVDILEQSISMGHALDSSRFSYNAFIESGASTSVRDFMESAIDASKNAVISGENMAVTFDSKGIRCRKLTDDGISYEPEQIAIINNGIVFTDDNWATAKMAIGCYNDPNVGRVWGVVAQNITGTLLAGQNLVIESMKKDGETAVFKVDSDGAVLHNAKFDIDNGVSHIVLDPVLGFAIGAYPVVSNNDGSAVWNEDNAKFWVDTDGNVHVKGLVEAEDFIINGKSVLTEDFKLDSGCLDLGNIQLDGKTGDITMTGNINLSGASSIVWGNNKPTTSITYDSIKSALQAANGTTETFITADAAGAPNIFGANIYGVKIYAGTGNTNNYTQMDEDGFHIHTTSDGGFNVYATFNETEYHFLSIKYDAVLSPYIMFQSPSDAYARWDFSRTEFGRTNSNTKFYGSYVFFGDVEFKGTVSGIKVVFG